MKKRLAAAALTISIVLTMSGCFPTGEKSLNTSNTTSDRTSFEYSKDHFTADFEIPDYSPDMPAKIRLKIKSFNAEEMIDLFFDGKTILRDKTWEGNYYADDDSLLCVDSNSLLFCDGKTAPLKKFQIEAPVNYQAVLTVDENYYRDTFDIGKELDSFSSQSATERALKLISTLGITNLGEPEIYAFSLDTLEKLRDNDLAFAFNDKYPLTEENEVYVLHFSRLFEGIEVADTETSIKDNTRETGISTVSSPDITVGISKDKIFYFNAEEIYEAEDEIVSNESAKYDLNYAVSELANYLEKAYFTLETNVDKAKAIYFPIERNSEGYTEFSLAWSFEGTINKDPSNYHKDDYRIVFLADTGRMI